MTSREYAALGLYNTVLPESIYGPLAVKGYLGKLFFQKPSSKSSTNLTEFQRNILKSPGTVSSMYRYLTGKGRKYIPELVEKELGDHFYTGLFKNLAKTPIGQQIVLSKFLDKTLPSVVGNKEIARSFITAGGQI